MGRRRRAARSILMLGLLVGIFLATTAVPARAETVAFSDPHLEATVRVKLGIAAPTPVTDTNMLGLSTLTARNMGITNLTGLDYAHNLVSLDVWGNQVSDLTPLSQLTSLRYLNVYENAVQTVAPLSGLSSLYMLSLAGNQISSLEPLSNMHGLNSLYLGVVLNSGTPNLKKLGNRVSDLSPLTGLSGLRHLAISHNPISTIAPLSTMTGLTELIMSSTGISDLTPVAGLTNLTWLAAASNHVTDLSPVAHLTKLEQLVVHGNEITDVSPIAGLTALRRLRVHRNQITDIGPLSANAGLGPGDVIELQDNYLETAVGTDDRSDIDTLVGRGASVTWEPQKTPSTLIAPLVEGMSVSATAGQVTVVFPQVLDVGELIVTPYAPRQSGPTSLRLLADNYFEIHPTPEYAGTAVVTLHMPGGYTGDLSRLKVLHWTDNAWETITPTVDEEARTLTFETASFSDFGVAEPLEGTPAVSTPASAPWSLALGALLAAAFSAFLSRRQQRYGARQT